MKFLLVFVAQFFLIKFFKIRLSFLEIDFKSPLCILGPNPLLVIGVASVFSQYLSCNFTFLMLLFNEQKFLIVIGSSLTIISFVGNAFSS